MLKVLCVDDDATRLKDIQIGIASKCAIGIDHIETCGSVREARTLLAKNYYDFLILDIVIPIRSGEKPDYNNGINLVYEIERRPKFNRPGKIIGITSYVDNKPEYEAEFEGKTFTIIPAPYNSSEWIDDICEAIQYGSHSTKDRKYELSDVVVVSIHGIQTYGNWQDVLDRSLNNNFTTIRHYPYKYGFFPLLLLFVPFLRFIEVRRFIRNVKPYLNEAMGKKIVVIAHSFGTYIAYHALKKVIRDYHVRIDTVIFSGSMLKSTVDLNFLRESGAIFINDCGAHDVVLCLSQLCVYGAGMAGRVGFTGLNSRFFMNRFFTGGHSLYFERPEERLNYVDQFWVPVIAKRKYPKTDSLPQPSVGHAVGMNILQVWGVAKDPVLIGVLLYVLYQVVLEGWRYWA